MGPGPDGIGMTLFNLTCGAWDIYNSVFTTQPAVAQRLPFPDGAPQITAATKAGPLVQSVRDCKGLQVGACCQDCNLVAACLCRFSRVQKFGLCFEWPSRHACIHRCQAAFIPHVSFCNPTSLTDIHTALALSW